MSEKGPRLERNPSALTLEKEKQNASIREAYERVVSTPSFQDAKFIIESGSKSGTPVEPFGGSESREANQEMFETRDVFTQEHNGAHITFYGIAHTEGTLIAQKEELIKAVSEADVVVLEGNPSTISHEKAREIVDYAIAHRDKEVFVPDEDLAWFSGEYVKMLVGEETPFTNPFENFFHGIGEMAAAGEKAVVSADPESGQNIQAKLTLELNPSKGIRRVDYKILISRALAGLTATVTAAYEASKLIRQPKEKESQEQSTNMSRRGFLKLAGASAIVAGAGLMNQRIQSRDNKEELVKPGALIYDQYNYRDMVTARGIDKYTKRFPGKKILVVYGQAHVRGIADYLESPVLTEVKDVLYAPFKSEKNPSMYEYKRDSTSKIWKETPLFEIE